MSRDQQSIQDLWDAAQEILAVYRRNELGRADSGSPHSSSSAVGDD